MKTQTLAKALEERIQLALRIIRHDIKAYGMSKEDAILRYLEHSTFGPVIIARLQDEA